MLLINWGGLAFSLFVAGVAALSLYEYGLLMSLAGRRTQPLLTILAGTALALGLAFDGPLPLILAASVALMVGREMFRPARTIEGLALGLFGAVFVGLMPAHLALIRELRPDGRMITLALFATVWIMDTAAYAVGRTAGRAKLAPELSPKKTWEGAIAGFVAAIATVLAARAAWFPSALTVPRAAALGAVIGVCGQLSDLAESMVKRAVGAKDSGALLPGHGGVMDRFDSFILAAPAVYYFLVLL